MHPQLESLHNKLKTGNLSPDDLKKFTKYRNQEADRRSWGETMLSDAAMFDRQESIRMLYPFYERQTDLVDHAVLTSAQYGTIKALSVLLNLGANPNAKSSENWHDALSLASINAHPQAVAILLSSSKITRQSIEHALRGNYYTEGKIKEMLEKALSLTA